MPDETFPLTLAGQTWNLPHFNFGLVKRLQGRVLRINSRLVEAGANNALAIDETAIDELLDIARIAINAIDPSVTKEGLESLTFPVSELIIAQTAIMRAIGLTRAKPMLGGPGRPKSTFDDFLAAIIDALGYAWTFEQVEQLTWPRWRALQKRLNIHPPLHWLVAPWLGYEAPAEKQYMDADAARDLMKRTGGKIDGISKL